MMDRYNMDQYNKETSQIHAPADLIRRTKEAVHEEEQRLKREAQQQNTAVQPRSSYGKVYRWALPVVAAVLCMVMLNISGMIVGRNLNGESSGSSMDMASEPDTSGALSGGSDTGVQPGVTEWMEIEDEVTDKSSEYDIEETVEDAAEEAMLAEAYDGGQTTDSSASAKKAVFTEDSFVNNTDGESRSGTGGNSYIENIYDSNLWIEEVEALPAFYDSPDTECVTIQDTRLYVGKDFDGAWIAYSQIDAGKYLISTEMTENEIDQEEFVREAYELLMRTTENL